MKKKLLGILTVLAVSVQMSAVFAEKQLRLLLSMREKCILQIRDR